MDRMIAEKSEEDNELQVHSSFYAGPNGPVKFYRLISLNPQIPAGHAPDLRFEFFFRDFFRNRKDTKKMHEEKEHQAKLAKQALEHQPNLIKIRHMEDLLHADIDQHNHQKPIENKKSWFEKGPATTNKDKNPNAVKAPRINKAQPHKAFALPPVSVPQAQPQGPPFYPLPMYSPSQPAPPPPPGIRLPWIKNPAMPSNAMMMPQMRPQGPNFTSFNPNAPPQFNGGFQQMNRPPLYR